MSLRDQFLVFQRLSADQLHESVPEQVWVVAVVEALEFEAEAKAWESWHQNQSEAEA